MGWFILKHIFATIFSLINIRRLPDQEKGLGILVLRQQLSILQRKLNHPIKPSKIEKLTLAILTNKLKRATHQTANQLRDVIPQGLITPSVVFYSVKSIFLAYLYTDEVFKGYGDIQKKHTNLQNAP
jgi:hypothetical protein